MKNQKVLYQLARMLDQFLLPFYHYDSWKIFTMKFKIKYLTMPHHAFQHPTMAKFTVIFLKFLLLILILPFKNPNFVYINFCYILLDRSLIYSCIYLLGKETCENIDTMPLHPIQRMQSGCHLLYSHDHRVWQAYTPDIDSHGAAHPAMGVARC